jgi:hypothetical protein
VAPLTIVAAMNYFTPIVPAAPSDEAESVDVVPLADNDMTRFWSPSSSSIAPCCAAAAEPVTVTLPSLHLQVKDDIECPNHQPTDSHCGAMDGVSNRSTVDAAKTLPTLTKLEETPSIATRTTQNTSDPENPTSGSSKDASSSGTQTLDSTSLEEDDEEGQRCHPTKTTRPSTSYHVIHALYRHAHGTLRKTVCSRLSNAVLVSLYTNRCQILWQSWHLVTTLMIAGTNLSSECHPASFMEHERISK